MCICTQTNTTSRGGVIVSAQCKIYNVGTNFRNIVTIDSENSTILSKLTVCFFVEILRQVIISGWGVGSGS